MVGALFTKIGLPIPTQISQSVLSSARDICDERSNTSNKVHVTDLPFGVEKHSKVDKQDAHFYRIHLAAANESLVLKCRSMSKSKFKLVLFDQSGGVRLVQESVKKTRYTAADMYLTNSVELMDLNEMWPPHLNGHEQELPEVFTKLTFFEVRRTISLEKGPHLICVYGDNWLSAVKYSVTCVKMEMSSQALRDIQETENTLVREKESLDSLQKEYLAAKKQYEDVVARVEEKQKYTDEVLAKREQAYEEFLAECHGRDNKVVPCEETPQRRFSSGGDSGGIRKVINGFSNKLFQGKEG